MDLATGMWIGAALFLLILVPYLVLEIRRGKEHGHTWFTGSSRAATAISDLIDEVERNIHEAGS